MIGVRGGTRQLIGQGETHVLKHIGQAWPELAQSKGEALLEEIFEDLVVEKDRVKVEGLLRVQEGTDRRDVDGQVPLEEGRVPLVLIGEGA